MGRKWNNIKEKKAQKDKNTSRIYAKFGKRFMLQQNLVNQTQNLTKL